METTQINLCRALKLKNRLASRLSRLDQLIIEYNSSIKDINEYDVRELYKRRMLLAQQLVQLKVDISSANRPMQKQIFEVAECKALCSMLGKVKTKHGPHAPSFSEAIQNFVAQFRKADIDKEVRKVEKEVDRLQEELDLFNFQTKIGVPNGLLDDTNDDV